MDPVNRFNHTNWVAIVTPTDRPKSVSNRCVIEVFGGVFVLSHCFLDFSVGVGAFVLRLSQISSFSLSLCLVNLILLPLHLRWLTFRCLCIEGYLQCLNVYSF